MPDITHETDDLESSWAALGRPSRVQAAPESVPPDSMEAIRNWLLEMSVEITTARTVVTLRREIVRLAILAGLNPTDIPERVFDEDRELRHRRQRATEFGYVPRPEGSTDFGRTLRDIALRLGDTNNRIAASEELINIARRLR